MRYYCKHCESEFSLKWTPRYPDVWEHDECPICGRPETLQEISKYETPEQYEKRTGNPVFSDTAVWFKIPENETFGDWTLLNYDEALQYELEAEEADELPCAYIVIASPPVSPPDDWRPE